MPSYKSGAVQVITTGDTINVTLESHATDDVIYLFAYEHGATVGTHSLTVATGWSELGSSTVTSGRDRRATLYRKVATSASETAPTIATTNTNGFDHFLVGQAVVDTVDTTTPEDVASVISNDRFQVVPNITDTITPVTANGSLLSFLGSGELDYLTQGAPTGFTLEDFDFATCMICFQADYGATGAKSVGLFTSTIDGSTTNDYMHYTIALRPGAGGSSALPLLNAYYYG